MASNDVTVRIEGQPALAWVVAIMQSYPHPWWVCGGWAVDLHLGRITRPHGDVDVAVDARHSTALAPALSQWPVTRTHFPTGEQSQWDGKPLAAGPDGLTPVGAPHDLEVLGALIEGDEWVFPRGSHRIRRSLPWAVRTTHTGLPYQAPEVVLLYKSRSLRDHDHADFHALLPALDPEQRVWLSASLPEGHPWAPDLREAR